MTKEDLAFIKALRSNGIEVTVPRPPELQEGKPEDQVYSGGLLPEAVVRPKEKSYAQILADAEEAQKANAASGNLSQAQKEDFARSILYSNNRSTQDKMQEYRDDPTNPLAYTPDADFSSIGYHLDKGNYGDAALYTAFAALPGAAGPVVKKVKPYIKKGVKTVVQPVFDNYRKVKNRLDVKDHLQGLGRGWYESPTRDKLMDVVEKIPLIKYPGVRNPIDSRPFFEKFPITATQKEAATLKQNEAFTEAIDFGENWFYDNTGKVRPEIIQKLEAIPPGGGMAKRGDVTKKVPDLLVSTRRADNIGLPVETQKRIQRDRNNLGVNFAHTPWNPQSFTFRNRGLYSLSPEDVARTGIHEFAHSFQKQGVKEFLPGKSRAEPAKPWMEFLEEFDLGNYWKVTGKHSKLGSDMEKAMVPDSGWYGSAGEVHSELMAARFSAAKDMVKRGIAPNLEEAGNILRQGDRADDVFNHFLHNRKGANENFFNWDASYDDINSIFKRLPALAPVVGVGAAAAARSEMDTSDNSYKEGGVEELQRGAIEDKVALAPDTGEIFLDQDKGATAKATRTSKAKSRKEERERAKKLGNLRRARSNENVQWLLYNIYKHESDKDAQGNINLGGFNQSAGNSSAFGSGQFIGDTRNTILEKYGVDAWSENPIEQEMASIALLEMNGLLKDVKKGKFKGNALTERVKVKDKKKPEGFRMDVQNWEAFVDDNKSRLIDKPKKKAETREWKRKLGTYRQNARYAPDESFSKIKPDVQSEKADLFKRNYEGIWPTGETVAPQGMPAVDFVMPGDTTNVRQQEVIVSSPKFVPAEEERSTATQQGIQGLPYKHGGMENFAYMRGGENERPRLNKDDLKFIKALRANGIEVSSTGYKHDSPDRNNAANLIVGDNINGTNLTMEGVPHGVRATGVDTGKTVDMMPGVKSYSFPQDSSVMEIPLKRYGGREIPEYMGGGITNTSGTGGGNFMTTGEMGTAMDVASGVGNVSQGLSSLGPDSTGVADVSGMGGMRQNAVEGTIGSTLSSIPIVGQFYQIGAGIGAGFGAGSDALHKKGDTEGGEILSGLEGAINPAEMFGRNAELWEAGYLTDAEAAMSFIGGFSGFGGVSNVGIDRRVREIQGQKHSGALTRATGGMHIGGYPHTEEVNRFPRATGYPKPKLT